MYNLASILDHHVASAPRGEAVVAGDRRLTWHDLHTSVGAVAGGLAGLGIGRGDVVAVLMYNRVEFLETLFAVSKLGAVLLPLNYRLAPREWQYIVDHAQAKTIVTEPEFVPAVGRLCLPTVAHRVVVGAANEWVSYGDLLASGAHVDTVDVDEHDLCRLMYTSGTTSRPKGVCLSHGNVSWKNLAHIVEFGLSTADCTLVCGPLYHVGGLDLPALGTLHAGGSVVLLRKFDAVDVVDTVEREQVTNIWLAPAMMNAVLNVPGLEEYDTSTIRFLIGGGEKMPEAVVRRVLTAFPGAWFADAYGLTETVSGDTFLDREHSFAKIGSVGKPVAHLRVRVLDPDGADVPVGSVGEVALRGPKVFRGYWRNEEATKAAFVDGWFRTGDVGRLDADGFLYIEDRKKDMIISGGENIATPEIERVLYEHPAVLEAAVVGARHERWGEVPKAYVVLRPGSAASEAELIEFCRISLAKFKTPTAVEFLAALPRTASGKVLKRELRTG